MYRYEHELQAIITANENLPFAVPAEEYRPAYDALRAAIAAYNAATGTGAGAIVSKKASVYVGHKRNALASWRRAAENAERFPLRANYEGAEYATQQMKDAHKRMCDAHKEAISK